MNSRTSWTCSGCGASATYDEKGWLKCPCNCATGGTFTTPASLPLAPKETPESVRKPRKHEHECPLCGVPIGCEYICCENCDAGEAMVVSMERWTKNLRANLLPAALPRVEAESPTDELDRRREESRRYIASLTSTIEKLPTMPTDWMTLFGSHSGEITPTMMVNAAFAKINEIIDRVNYLSERIND